MDVAVEEVEYVFLVDDFVDGVECVEACGDVLKAIVVGVFGFDGDLVGGEEWVVAEVFGGVFAEVGDVFDECAVFADVGGGVDEVDDGEVVVNAFELLRCDAVVEYDGDFDAFLCLSGEFAGCLEDECE